ncbi:hypothetical protein EPHNCH_0845 [Anaplasma phagocytophilum str. NCH-1]|uniref:Uncharacterized protein n=1 Tax=Anaplasma phagocytophilum str. NCH-1 TaxID=1359161 RepID=A0A0F3NBX1_ANAPH|nr:hypothetical protein EPHNCH_0845 [Anaplasma phagocytophilum str. NCH-1]
MTLKSLLLKAKQADNSNCILPCMGHMQYCQKHFSSCYIICFLIVRL